MSYEDEIIAKYSTPELQRNVLPRSTKKLNMEFDAQYNDMTKVERDEFLDKLYPEEAHDRASVEPAAPSTQETAAKTAT